MTIMTPILALICWTLIVWVWLYSTRVPAMQKAKIHPQKAIHPGSLSGLPVEARVVADNYNHLHEQPTIFYALAIYSHLVGVADPINIYLAWAYVVLRVAHSVAQIILKKVMIRFSIFALTGVILIIMAVRNLIALAV